MPKLTKKPVAKKSAVADEGIYEIYDWQSLSPHPVIGIDEVGRGCLAGPVYAAAAVVPLEHVEVLVKLGVTDSKLLTSEKRESLATEILKCCHVGVGYASHEEIDSINILQASFLAMRRALRELEKHPVGIFQGSRIGRKTAHILIDGNQRIPMHGTEYDGDCAEDLKHFATALQTTLIKGDLRALPIAAASIVAKVTRDKVMRDAAVEFPNYGFESHKGYAAVTHREAIERYGPSRIHRKTFSGVREFLGRLSP